MRDIRGERHGRALLTEAQVQLLRKLHKEGKGGAELHRTYGEEWGISQQNVYAILAYRTWKHLEAVA